MSIVEKIRDLSGYYSRMLQESIQTRTSEMQNDDKSHYLIYRLLGISESEGEKIDLYQNTGRFLYRYAGGFLETATKLCFQEKFPDASVHKIPNPQGNRPKTFEIDCLVGQLAYEIKWRDATTDGDHVIKEHTRIKAITQAGFIPTRLMYYYPNRNQAMRIQSALEDLYIANGGLYYYGHQAWSHVHEKTGVNLFKILQTLADELKPE